jgi:hypothetical protein
MATEWVAVRNALVARDTILTHRWYDAVGPNVRKWGFDGSDTGVVSTTTMAGQTITVSTAGTLVGVASDAGGGIAFTPAAQDNQGIQIQAGSESFYFGYKWPCYFGCRYKQVDITQSDYTIGLMITDTDIVDNGVTDGIYFRTVDTETNLDFVLEKNSAETETNVLTQVDATYYTVEFYYDGESTITAYVNGTEAASVSTSNANFPNDEHLAPAIALLSGEASANTLTVNWARAIQIQD